MRTKILSSLIALAGLCGTAYAATPFVNLTPTPKSMTVAEGAYTLPAKVTISAEGLGDEMTAEASRFAQSLAATTGLEAVLTAESGATIAVSKSPSLDDEGYTLKVTSDGIQISASEPAGLFYAFQSIKKMLPANVMAGVSRPGTEYSLPLVDIKDEPRYQWRGFELDCARHFFTLDRVKKMIDVMATYKMNRLHWHLTDDQGWRLEMPKYPKLTSAAAAPLNNYWYDFEARSHYMLNEPYGPYYYTVDEMKELVAYARERHIEICPEVDMPGHMQAAIAAYPEFSTTPESAHPVRYWPGVSTDILDLSNPAVMQFTKDIMDELIKIFPYEYIHIGGDECPVTAWQNSPSCQQLKADLGLQSEQALQNWFAKQMADYVKPHGKRLVCWNEVLTNNGADKQMAKEADFLVFSWLNGGAANNPSRQAADLGLRSVWCSNDVYYLDFPQWDTATEPKSIYTRPVNLEAVYNARPDYEASRKELYYGVNCNLWTEYIAEPDHMEYMALPRMIAVAETGWSPESKKDFRSFKQRFNADTEYLDLADYTYGRHYVEGDRNPSAVYPEAGEYYRIITCASQDAGRRDRCIELVAPSSSLIADKGASAGLLWTNVQAADGAENLDWQYWTFEADPAGGDKFAMICRARPQGSVNPAMNGSSVSARWSYDDNNRHYDFILGEHFASTADGYTYSIRSSNGSSMWINCGQAGQNNAVNNWDKPADGNGGIWLFAPEHSSRPAFTPLDASKTYAFINAADKLAGAAIDDSDAATARSDRFALSAWQIIDPAYDAEAGVQTFKLRNAKSLNYIGEPSTTAINTTSGATPADVFGNNGGYPVGLTADASAAATISLVRADAESDDYLLFIGGKRLTVLPENFDAAPCGLTAMDNAPASQGAHWRPVAVEPTVIECYEGSTLIGTWFHARKAGEDVPVPAIDYYDFKSSEETAAGIRATYERRAWPMVYRCYDTDGILWDNVTVAAPIGETYTPAAPVFSHLTDGKIEGDSAPFEPESAREFTVRYTTSAIPGVKRLGNKVSTVEAGRCYVIRDAHSDRNAYRNATAGKNVGGTKTLGSNPAYVWTLEADGSSYKIKNLGNGLYVRAVTTQSAEMSAKFGGKFNLTYNAAARTWTIQNAGNSLCWDGQPDLSMVGWDAPGHPYEFYDIAECTPYYEVSIVEKDHEDKTLASRSIYVAAGDSYCFVPATRKGYDLISVDGAEGLGAVADNITVTVNYAPEGSGINAPCLNADKAGVKGIYDLGGRRLEGISRPGIYIVDGKKVLVK